MAKKTVVVSDITGDDIQGNDLISVIVHEHPAIDKPVKLDAADGELEELRASTLDLTVIEIVRGGERERLVIETSAFNKLFTDDANAVLSNADAAPASGRQRGSANTERINYATIEHAGSKHRGVVTDAEAAIVRENLEAINERLAANGERTIDPTDADMQKRYGFTVEGDAE